MQFTLVALSSLLAVACAHSPAWYKSHPRVARPPVCGGDTVAACCELNAAGAASLDCVSPGNPTSIKKFTAVCAAAGRTPECCATLAGGVGALCQDIA